jgi:hydrogenase maturation factor
VVLNNDMQDLRLPVGKLPPDLLSRLLSRAPLDESVVLGPGIGLDCAVVETTGGLLVLKSDPITFASDEIGWYAVQINANDIAVMGATPRWFLVTLLLPEKSTTHHLPQQIMAQVYAASRELGISVIGGHTEITYGVERPILAGTMIGEVDPQGLITPRGARPGDRLLLTKGIPIEATAILAREFAGDLSPHLSPEEIQRAKDFLFQPGISVLRDVQMAVKSGRVHAMHDPTEGGLSAALWELAEASGCSITIDREAVKVHDLSRRLLGALNLGSLDPMALIASGALLISVHPEDSAGIRSALVSGGIECTQIGSVESLTEHTVEESQDYVVWTYKDGGRTLLPRPERDEITKVFGD